MSAKEPVAQSAFAKWTIRLMAAIGVLGCLAIIAIVVMISGNVRRHEPTAVVQAGATKQVFEIGSVEKVPGTSLMKIAIFATNGQRYGGSASYDSEKGDLRNVLLLDTVTGKSRRLLPNNNRRIEAFDFLSEDREDAPACCYYLSVDRADNTLHEEVILGVLATGQQATVLPEVDGFDSVSMPDKDHVALIVRDRQRLSIHFVDLATLKVTATHPIAIN